jgi:membrane protease YdiL (CAAX protease family)
MQSLKSKRFFLDYLIGSTLIVTVFFVLVGNITIMDTRGTLTLAEACTSSGSSQEIVKSAQVVLRDGEHCKIEQPCNIVQSPRCEGTARVTDIFMHAFAQDLLIVRVKRQLNDQYGFGGYSDRSTFRVPTRLIIPFLMYFLVLVETGALLFALWRQNLLASTFFIPPESKKELVLKFLFYGVTMAIVIIAVSNILNMVFEYSVAESRKVMLDYFRTTGGIVLAVVVAPFAEELIFRGVFLRFFIERNKQVIGIVLVSVLFSILHGFLEEMAIWQFFASSTYFIFSIVLCRMYIKQKSLWAPIICHSAYNTVNILYFNVMS